LPTGFKDKIYNNCGDTLGEESESKSIKPNREPNTDAEETQIDMVDNTCLTIAPSMGRIFFHKGKML
jgi:hypothetical protein